jgi:hypothetical protein
VSGDGERLPDNELIDYPLALAMRRDVAKATAKALLRDETVTEETTDQAAVRTRDISEGTGSFRSDETKT